MAQKKKGGLINRILMGSEKSEGYARASLPSNRWELFWDIFKGRFWKLVLINLLVLLFFIPLIAILYFHKLAIIGYGSMYPFGQGFGVGYMSPVSFIGYEENIRYNVNTIVYMLLPIGAFFASLGLAGGAYVIRNMVWTEGIFVANDFWRGIKQNFKQMLIICLVYSLLFYVSSVSLAFCDYNIAVGSGKKWLFIISKILSYGFLGAYSIMTMHMITMSVTYELKFKDLIKNSFLFTIGLLPHNLLFLFLGAIPFLLLSFEGIMLFLSIGIILVLLFGFSLFLLVWTDFCQWAYDKFINDKVEGAKKNRGIYEKVKESNSAALKQYREQLAMVGRSSLNSRPIKPITDDELQVMELPTSFNRADLEKLKDSKDKIIEDHLRYVEEHKNDPEFQKTEADIKIEKDEAEKQKRIEAAKRELAKRKNRK